MAQDVTIRVLDQNSSAVENVGVHLYDGNNQYRVSYGFTDAAGEVLFLAVAEGTAYVRLYTKALPLVSLTSPHEILVRPTPTPNIFEVSAVTADTPAPRTPGTCCVYGKFSTANLVGRRLAIHITCLEDPVSVVPGGEVGGVLIPSDENGYLQFELTRLGLYSAVVPGYEDEPIIFRVPDAATADVVALLFPVVDTLVFSPGGPLAMVVGDEVALPDTALTLTSGFVLNGDTFTDVPLTRFLTYVSSDESVATVSSASDGTPVVLAVSAGSASISAEIKDAYEAYGNVTYPATTLTVVPVAVTVT